MDVEQLRKQAKELVRAARAGGEEALARLGGREPILANAQLVVARERGFRSWAALLAEGRMREAVPRLSGRRATAATPREAAEVLVAQGIFSFPSGPRTVTRGRITLMRSDPSDAKPREPDVTRERVVVEGPPFTVDTDSVRFVKEREILGRHLFAVSFDAISNHLKPGRRMEMGRVIVASRSDDGWRAGLGSGFSSENAPPRVPLPYVALGTHWRSGEGFCGAARVFPGEASVTSIRIRFPDGVTSEADSDEELALFFVADPPALSRTASYTPETIELLAGELVIATQAARRPPDRRPRESG
jgi:hypothetical protein